MVFSTSVTSSPNGSFEAAGGGAVGCGACIDASERTARLTAAAAAADNHQIREALIGFSPAPGIANKAETNSAEASGVPCASLPRLK
jgi:hypothetical protein